jgi:transposase
VLTAGVIGQDRTYIDEVAIQRAITEVKADPNLATEQTIKTLRWRSRATPTAPKPARVEWLADLVRWINQSARVLMWATLAVLAAVIAGFVVRMVNGVTAIERVPRGRAVPTHVQDLDIRPETLPADIGRAARQLWDGGDHRAALSLLYRGLLSRLAHVHRLPIRDSSTEGDCLTLASRLGVQGSVYAARLISTWQASVYGHAATQTATVHDLCDDFSVSLDTLAAPAAAGDEA